MKELIPDDPTCTTGSTWPRAHRLPGPAGADLLGRRQDRVRLGLAFNEMVKNGELKARSSSAATTWTPARWRARTARPIR